MLMTPAEVLAEARRRRVVLSARGDMLHYRGPSDSISPDPVEAFRRHKAAILDLIAAPIRERARLEALEAEFVRRHDVREFKNSYRNLLRLMKSAGADAEDARTVADAMSGRPGIGGAHSGPFDHGRLFGRGGVPTILVGHPYSLTREGERLLYEIRAAGFFVGVNGPSFYGFGTMQVLVMRRDHPPATSPARSTEEIRP